MEQAIPHPNGITVRGEAELTADPNQATIHFMVEAEGMGSADSYTALQKKVGILQPVIEQPFVDKFTSRRVQTLPQYQFHPKTGKNTFLG